VNHKRRYAQQKHNKKEKRKADKREQAIKGKQKKEEGERIKERTVKEQFIQKTNSSTQPKICR